ncbi:MAG TPA: DinB family protein [Bacteroidia bacterium]|nr:DinB family protein [Bacteroidia bacterium]
MITPPPSTDYAAYYETYISLIRGRDPLKMLESQVFDFKALLSEIPAEKEEFRYAEGKWSVKEVIGHINDTERVMSYRALCFARGEKKELPGFEENDYAKAGMFDKRSLYDLGHEFGFIREATIALFKSMSADVLDNRGIANHNTVTPRALLYIIAGHHQHHERVLRERYLADIL